MTKIPSRDDIAAARTRLAGYVRETPVIAVDGAEFGLASQRLLLKLELMQHTGSFKPRGAFHRVLCSTVPESGLIAASGGNHGLAVAYVGSRLRMATEIFVPRTVPPIKLARLRQYGADVRLEGEYYDAAREASERRARETGALVVHAYDQIEVVAGAGTTGLELEAQTVGVDTVLVAVGGGGLMAGVACWGRGHFNVVAVEPVGCPTLHSALEAGRPVPVEVGGVASDSLAARQIGEIAFAAARGAGVKSTLVDDDAIRRAQALLWDRLRLVVEPGGATALAALLSGAYAPVAGERVAVLVCGANTDPASLPTLS
jgi:threonine dehydratase